MRSPPPRRLLPALGLLLAGGCGPNFTEYTSAEGRFSVRVPGTPRVTSKEIPGATVYLATVEQPAGRYVVGWMDLKPGPDEREAPASVSLGNARDSAVRSVGGRLLSDNKISLGAKQYPGLDVLIELPGRDNLTRDRIYLANGRLYQVMASGRKWWVESADAQKFLDSFRLEE